LYDNELFPQLPQKYCCFNLGFHGNDYKCVLFVFIVTAVGLFRILPIPLLKAMMSRIVQPDQQVISSTPDHRRISTSHL